MALELLVDGTPVLSLLANAYRADLRQAGFGSGCHAFDLQIPGEFAGSVTVKRISDGAVLGHTDAASQARQAA